MEDNIMNLAKWNSPGTMSQFFDDLFDNSYNTMQHRSVERMPSTNIKESDDSFDLDLAVPGMKKDDFKISLENNILSISCEMETVNDEEKENYTRREFSFGSFSRSFRLPKVVSSDEIGAEYKDGILTVNLPKKEEDKAKLQRTIAVA